MYGRRASQLLKEIDSSEAGQLAPFNSDIFDQVIRECNEHSTQFQSLISKMVDQNLDIETTRNEDHYGAAIHHLSLLRNKRCLMAYMYNRAEVIKSFRWKIGPVLPHDIQEKLHFSEKEYFKNHSAAIKSYISEMDIDLTVDMVPPKDPYIQVRVLEDIGEVSLGDHSISLTKNSLHFLRRTDVEQFISQVRTYPASFLQCCFGATCCLMEQKSLLQRYESDVELQFAQKLKKCMQFDALLSSVCYKPTTTVLGFKKKTPYSSLGVQFLTCASQNPPQFLQSLDSNLFHAERQKPQLGLIPPLYRITSDLCIFSRKD